MNNRYYVQPLMQRPMPIYSYIMPVQPKFDGIRDPPTLFHGVLPPPMPDNSLRIRPVNDASQTNSTATTGTNTTVVGTGATTI